mmetsp:Transcript_90890/g.283149  ORF Transcript_90890/g.283149 Transcript_90890/m.283149 type:complete len:211 (+) Transcript_90890:221-853(+)
MAAPPTACSAPAARAAAAASGSRMRTKPKPEGRTRTAADATAGRSLAPESKTSSTAPKRSKCRRKSAGASKPKRLILRTMITLRGSLPSNRQRCVGICTLQSRPLRARWEAGVALAVSRSRSCCENSGRSSAPPATAVRTAGCCLHACAGDPAAAVGANTSLGGGGARPLKAEYETSGEGVRLRAEAVLSLNSSCRQEGEGCAPSPEPQP